MKLDLQTIAAEKPVDRAAASAQAARAGGRERLGWLAAVVAAVVLGVTGAVLLYHPPQLMPSIRSSIPPSNLLFQLTGDAAGPPVLSPDGKLIAFTAVSTRGNLEIWVRPLNSLEAHPIEGTDEAYYPFWSPDSRSLGFFVPGKLKRVDLNGGSPTDVTVLKQGKGGAWSPSGVIVCAPEPSAPLMKVSASGGFQKLAIFFRQVTLPVT